MLLYYRARINRYMLIVSALIARILDIDYGGAGVERHLNHDLSGEVVKRIHVQVTYLKVQGYVL